MIPIKSIFYRSFRRNTNILTQNPTELQIQGSEITEPTEIQLRGSQRVYHVNNPTEIQLSGDKREQSDQSKDSTISKYCRFELEPENIEND